MKSRQLLWLGHVEIDGRRKVPKAVAWEDGREEDTRKSMEEVDTGLGNGFEDYAV